uniref:NAD_Gly3P_dh_N domain-containing protein n=1 Tax=Gongylonema pulchrum TaxID=637853 RepID=A0A183DK66_9BILA
LMDACKDSDMLIFVIPHQFVENVCNQLKGHLREDVLAVSLIKGFMIQKKKGGIRLVTEEIRSLLNIDTAVLMGANLAQEVANEDFCEATIGMFSRKVVQCTFAYNGNYISIIRTVGVGILRAYSS